MQSVPPAILGAPHEFRFRHRQGGEAPTIIHTSEGTGTLRAGGRQDFGRTHRKHLTPFTR